MHICDQKQVILRERWHSSLLFKIAKHKIQELSADAMATTITSD